MPTKLKRRIQPVSRRNGILNFKMKSRSRNDGTTWEQRIDTVTGQMLCDCPGFMYRRRCEHIKRAVECSERNGLKVGGCFRCHGTDGLFEVADADGEAIKGSWICGRCVKALRS